METGPRKRKDDRLLRAVEKHGRQWKQIQESYYKSRSRNDLKNRYTIITRRASNSDNGGSTSNSTFVDTGETSTIRPTSSTSSASCLTQDEYAVDYSHSKAFPTRPSQQQQNTGSTDYWQPAPQDTLTSWSSSYAAPMTSTFSDPPAMMPWSQQVPPNLQGVLDGQYYPADDAPPPVHDPYYQTPMNNISGGTMAVNNGYSTGVSPLPVANTGDLDNGDVADYDRDMVYNPFMYNAQ
ncbi:hypothetical protein PG988_013969 [Apiospora saccharicola]